MLKRRNILACFISCFSLLLSGCTIGSTNETEDQMIHIDWDYGVRYVVNENNANALSEVRLYIDPQREDVIASLSVTLPKEMDDVDEKEAVELMQLYNTEMSVMKEMKCTYVYPENDGIHEFIRLNFFLDDDTDISAMIQYLGLEEEFEDGILYYEKELLNSENFRYQWILEEGNFENNISFSNDSEYDYPSQ